MKFSLFSDVQNFYSILVEALKRAERSITMMYYEFHAGEWAVEISRVLMEKQVAGVTVHLMVDEFGLLELPPLQAIQNRALVDELAAAGVHVHIFHPKQIRTSNFNRLHFKACAIDGRTLFLGGSDIADEYRYRQDLNLRADGDLGSGFEEIFEYLVQSGELASNGKGDEPPSNTNLPRLFVDESRAQVVLTVPDHRQEVRRQLLGLILTANETIYICTKIFLPDQEIINTLLHQLKHGRRVNILLSDHTHTLFIDVANQVIIHKLVQAGAKVWRYAPEHMHSRACWNEQGTILFGSVNLDSKARIGNYECSLLFKDQATAKQLQLKFEQDLIRSYPISLDTFSHKHWLQKVWVYLNLLAATWL